jgi:D-3-phosphoglycerate dehydrogenase / 2-oxoglutarate reductase
MDVLIVESIEPEVLHWLEARHSTRYAPQLERDPFALRQALFNARALLMPSSVALDAQALHFAPVLRAVGCLGAGVENLDLSACARKGIEVVRTGSASAAAEAEFAIGAMLQLLRRVPVRANDGQLVGRELGGTSVGLLGMSSAARPLAGLLEAFGARVLGYDPALHRSDGMWARWKIEPTGLRELFESSDVVCVLLSYFTRYKGLLGERQPGQVLVNLARSSLFDEHALAEVLNSGRMAAAWFDSVEPGLLEPGRPLFTVANFQATPRVAGVTREARVRGAWAVARRIDEILSVAPPPVDFSSTSPDDLPDPEDGPASA